MGQNPICGINFSALPILLIAGYAEVMSLNFAAAPFYH